MLPEIKGHDRWLDPPETFDDGPHLTTCKAIDNGVLEECDCGIWDKMAGDRESYYERLALEDYYAKKYGE